ncbi:MAG TPA: hypothetical protein PL018_02650 [Ignavibacteriaceae bacterium]|nr:hypothetical protein [Ignavibacteriaceae bacterium]HRP92158.1 hypothetical protein [Ignavibacteriaceae bacterium]HRQ53125.1 hypothetical protein [Ignavibacteriaceae bacterium]
MLAMLINVVLVMELAVLVQEVVEPTLHSVGAMVIQDINFLV